MFLIPISSLLNSAGIFLAIVIVIGSYIKWKYDYWTRRKFPFIQSPNNFSLTSFKNSREMLVENSKYLYNKMKENKLKFCGSNNILSPFLIISDLDLIRNILTKDFEYFTDRSIYRNEKDPLDGHLFSLGGKEWRNLRVKLTPTFTSGKMRYMMPILVSSSKLLEDFMKEKCEKQELVNIKDTLSCFTTDIIGSCAFGLDCNTFQDPNSPFRYYGKKLFKPDFSRIVKSIFTTNFPEIAKLLGYKSVPDDIANFFLKIVEETVDYREKNNTNRKDFLQLLIDLKNNNQALEKSGDHVFGLKEMAAQCFVFFIAGFETSSTLMTLTLYELCLAKDIQDKLRQEIISVLKKYDDQVTYDGIKEMTYLHQVLTEALRKYPPVPLNRRSVKDYKIPGTDCVIEKNTKILIPVHGIHYDSDYYPEPEKFNPERFNEENKHKRHPYAYLPFGEGPRNCIGLRFGLMQSKVGLIAILRNHKISLDSKCMIAPIKSFVLGSDLPIWLKLEST